MWLLKKAPTSEVASMVSSEMVLTRGKVRHLICKSGVLPIHSLGVLSLYTGSNEISRKIYTKVSFAFLSPVTFFIGLCHIIILSTTYQL